MKKACWILGLLVVLYGCASNGDQNSSKPGSDDKNGKSEFVPWVIQDSAGIQSFKSGLKFYSVLVGPGEFPKGGQNVLVHYHGTLEDGTVYDSSLERDQPIQFTVGSGKMIPGFSEGIRRMKYGSKAILFIPPDLGYGAKGKEPNIPPNSQLIFYVELLGTF